MWWPHFSKYCIILWHAGGSQLGGRGREGGGGDPIPYPFKTCSLFPRRAATFSYTLGHSRWCTQQTIALYWACLLHKHTFQNTEYSTNYDCVYVCVYWVAATNCVCVTTLSLPPGSICHVCACHGCWECGEVMESQHTFWIHCCMLP